LVESYHETIRPRYKDDYTNLWEWWWRDGEEAGCGWWWWGEEGASRWLEWIVGLGGSSA
jgi:hypothetical protein